MKGTKLNLKERFIRFYKNQNIAAKILFVPFALSAAAMVLTLFNISFIYITALLGLVWFASTLIPRREKRDGIHNPFTKPLVLCAAVCLGCLVFCLVYNPRYPETDGELNRESLLLQENLNNPYGDTEQILNTIRHNIQVINSLEDVNHNYVITDADGSVLFSSTSWKTGGEDTLRALISPFPINRAMNYHLMLLVNEQGSVVATFRVPRSWMGSGGGNPYSALTISDEAASESVDPMFDRYFPSFGSTIDSMLFALSDSTLKYSHEENERRIHIMDWTGQTVTTILDAYTTGTAMKQVVEELNSLTEEERVALQKYMTWIRQAYESIYPADHSSEASEARILTSADGELTLYILYEYNHARINPRYSEAIEKIRMKEYVMQSALLLLPVIIILLSFWVFTDAKRRGHKFPALWAVLTLMGNVIAWIIYLMVRPNTMVNAEGKVVPKGSCPLCGTKLKSDYIACPGCDILLRNKCLTCGRALENDWSFCPYCTTPIVRTAPTGVQDEASENGSEIPEEESAVRESGAADDAAL